jgi:methionyl-tRNA formyltransferase
MGTPGFAVPALEALVASPHHIVAVYTQPPRPAGRGQKIARSPVHEAAASHGIEVRHPDSLKPEAEKEAFAALDLDAAVVAGYGLLLPKAILAAPRHGCFNIHSSLLPRWRGAAPIQWGILAGDSETGVTIMRLEPGMDTGPMLIQQAVPITPDSTSAGLYDEVFKLGARLILPALEGCIAGTVIPVRQDEAGATHARKLTREDGRLDWAQPAPYLHRQIRALVPWPGTWFDRNGEIVKVAAAQIADSSPSPSSSGREASSGTLLDDRMTIACGEGALRLVSVQRPGRGWVDGAAFMRGAGLKAGDKIA